MRIYFEDGKLERANSIDFRYHYMVDAGWGFTQNESMLEFIKLTDNNAFVYTNSLIALNNKFAWNEELGVPDIYMFRDDKFVRIDKLTDRELRIAHNIEKMYVNGEFRH